MELSRLWRWAVPKSPTSALRSRPDTQPTTAGEPSADALATNDARTSALPGGATPRTEVANSNAEPEPGFFARIVRELPPVLEVASEDEPRIAKLVLQIVAYVTQKKLDPPVMPALVPRVLAIVNEPEVDLLRLTHVIQQDLAISAKLMSVANSPMFGGHTEVQTVRQAIAHLGTEQVAQVAIGLACRSSMESRATLESPFAARWQRLFHHGMTCAFAAAQLAGKADKEAQEAAFLGGLFHDVGKAVALRAIEALAAQGELDASLGDAVIDEAIQRIHAYPGDEFYEKWTLPEALMQLCARHHQLEEVEHASRSFYLVSLCSSLDALQRGSFAERREALEQARVSGERLGLTDAALRAAHEDTRKMAERTARMFGG